MLITAELKNNRPGLIINFLLDGSGSMKSQTDATIEAFNHYVEEQKNSDLARREGVVFFCLTIFDSDAAVIYTAKEIHDVPLLTKDVYHPDRGWTALNDAICESCQSISQSIADWEDKPQILTVVLTDGREQGSKRFSHAQTAELITQHKGLGWNFVFMGSDPYTRHASQSYGIAAGNTLEYARGDVKMSMRRLAKGTATYCAAIRDHDANTLEKCSMDFFAE